MNSKIVYINSFTVIEAVIGMVITAIIMAIIFVVFTITSERLLDFKNANVEIIDLNRLNYALSKDMFYSKHVNNDDGQANFIDMNDKVITYVGFEKKIIRTCEEFTDTFHINVKEINLDTLTSADRKHNYQRLKLKIVEKQRFLTSSYYKKIYPAELINKSSDEY